MIFKDACDWFVGREKETAQIQQYITGFSNNCFVVYGPPGSGTIFKKNYIRKPDQNFKFVSIFIFVPSSACDFCIFVF